METHLLGRDFVGLAPHVHLLIDVNTGDDEEDPGTAGPSCQEAPKPEYDRAFILLKVMVIWENITLETHLNHFDHKEEGEWKRGDNHEECADCE